MSSDDKATDAAQSTLRATPRAKELLEKLRDQLIDYRGPLPAEILFALRNRKSAYTQAQVLEAALLIAQEALGRGASWMEGWTSSGGGATPTRETAAADTPATLGEYQPAWSLFSDSELVNFSMTTLRTNLSPELLVKLSALRGYCAERLNCSPGELQFLVQQLADGLRRLTVRSKGEASQAVLMFTVRATTDEEMLDAALAEAAKK